MNIILTTLNARYIHASLGLRYLLANMGDLKAQTTLREFTIARKPHEVAGELLALLGEPEAGRVQIIGLGVYIWNVAQSTELVRQLKAARPGVQVVLGGPEVSHELDQQAIVQLADFVITGWGDLSFAQLCRALLHGPPPLMKVMVGEQPALENVVLPYAEYSAADLAQRVLYLEASRGCPFKCEFCLSSLDQTAWAFDLDRFLAALQTLYQRGARHFKFVDRTFNLKLDASLRILQFFLDRLPTRAAAQSAEESSKLEVRQPDVCSGTDAEAASAHDLSLHFEVVPDHLPERLKAMIAQFPPGVLQLEIGVQSFNPAVQQRISRKQDNDKTEQNLRWLVKKSHAHLHADLIFGLPGETLQSFAAGFDRLYSLGPHEIQLGMLKRLRGTPIARHSQAFAMVYDPAPPYTVQQTAVVDSATVQRFARFARYWDLIANSGRFRQTLALLMATRASSAFESFQGFADWLWRSTEKTSGLTPEVLVDALFDYLVLICGLAAQTVRDALLADYQASGARASPRVLKGWLPKQLAPAIDARKALVRRQQRHLSSNIES